MITPFLISILLLLLLLALPDIGVALITRRHRYRRVEDLPACDDALLLGTAKYLASGGHNVYYQYRIQAAIDLWRAGKTKRFVVSGNGLTEAVSETAAMQADLVAAGIPAGVIWQDEAGMRTLDSIVRYADTFDTPRGQRRLWRWPGDRRRWSGLGRRFRRSRPNLRGGAGRGEGAASGHFHHAHPAGGALVDHF